ncbi:hypothetical protein AJ78_07943 [Emergomyces pasteurianus Ep9510]|uniref:Major facilitator superfamily (MFS) profile domain-containing protein n=1 Tax=Emergomyces pasteurianus Ep9510 TaxID=1447872 RepID=A0A1J9Q7V3_9EURO|nr:hypothetical protein AJ78_07943 [Emergomyces pasteurianus Ep9510]
MHSAQSIPETAAVHEQANEMETYHEDLDSETTSVDENMESDPFLTRPSSTKSWVPPKGFVWIQVAIFTNVFLSGFDGTITASTYAVISSEFNAANNASWLTTSYLITSTAFQPLYGRFSDIFGRRACFFTSTIAFMLGCLGCALAPNIVFLNLMRAVTGLGGGGLVTMATIINSDMIPFKERGMYQAVQNVLNGFGSICGASLGGSIADTIGWRWCFLLQVPMSIFALVVGHLVVKNQSHYDDNPDHETPQTALSAVWNRVDLSGALLLIVGLCSQLVGLSLGGNELPWSSPWVILSLVASALILGVFLYVEATTSAMAVIPPHMLRGRLAVSAQISNVCVGMAAYAFLFMLPLFFQVVLKDSASTAGARLIIPSLANPVGGVISGFIMSRWGQLANLVRIGSLLMFIGNALVMLLGFDSAKWKFITYVIPASLGQGIVYPSILFTVLAAFDHADHAVSSSTVYLIRSLGTVWGVAITSAITQNTLKTRLPAALIGVPDKWKIIEEIRHSVLAISKLPPDAQVAARQVYHDGINLSFAVSAGFGLIATVSAMFASGKGLSRSTKSDTRTTTPRS